MTSSCQDEPRIFSQAKSFRFARRRDAPAGRRPRGRTLCRRRGFLCGCRRRLCLRILGHGLRCLPRLDADVAFLTTGEVNLNHPGPEMIWIENPLGQVGGLKRFDIKKLKVYSNPWLGKTRNKDQISNCRMFSEEHELVKFFSLSTVRSPVEYKVSSYPLYNPRKGGMM